MSAGTYKSGPLRAYVIGRSPYADIVLADSSVARRHAELLVTRDGRLHLTDCGGRSGTWRLASAGESEEADKWEPLRQDFVKAGELLRFGDLRLRLGELLGDADAALSRSGGEPAGAPAGAPPGGGRWRWEIPASGAEKPRGRVERDPVTGEIVSKRF